MTNLPLNDRETTTVLTALELLREVKQETITGKNRPRGAINSYDLLAPEHTLMHTLTLLAKLTNKPVEYFARNPSQNKPEAIYEEPTHGKT